MNFTNTVQNIYRNLYESKNTNSLLYKEIKNRFIASIKDSLQNIEYPLYTIYDWNNKTIPDIYIDMLLKDKKCITLLNLFLNKNNVGGIDNIYLYNKLNSEDQEIYRNNRSNTIKKSSIIRQNKKAEEVYFTKVDEFLCQMYPEFARNCGEPFYSRYFTEHMKNVLSRDEEDDISNW